LSLLASGGHWQFDGGMDVPTTRRRFLKQTSVVTAGVAAWNGAISFRAIGANDRILVGVIGCNGRGMDHISGFLSVPNVEIAYICDVDNRALSKGAAAAGKKQSTQPKGVGDLRRLLEDRAVDAVSIATPDHWHSPAAILACVAGKHVYVEKPGSHNLHESELMVAAARKHKRHVQMGNQRRSWPWIVETISSLHNGEIGAVKLARAWYTNHRPSIGHGQVMPVPAWLDWSLWQGPAPEQPFRDNVVHYNWHWFWSWGTGELGNNAVHALDLARWGLRVDAPKSVSCGGGRYHFKDDWETPDTTVAMFDYGDKAIAWDGQSCDPRGFEGASFGVGFYGEKGFMTIAGDTCRVYDLNDKLVREVPGKGDDVVHFANFIAAIREGKSLNSEIEEGQRSARLCHLANIAWRSGHTLQLQAPSWKIVSDKKASAFVARTYRHGWEPKL
jgi:predicted dehydrogenase